MKLIPKLRFKEFKDDWHNDVISNIAKVTSGGTPNRNIKEYWDGGNIPWITTSLINSNVIDQAEEFITEEGVKNSSAKMFPVGTILLAMYGQGKTRGKVSLLGIEATTNQACAAILVGKNIDSLFLFQNLDGRYEEIRGLSNEGGQQNLSGDIIKKIEIHFPSLPEQQKIAAFLSAVDEKIQQLTRKKEHLTQYKKGVMQQLFSGKLRFRDAINKPYPKWEEKRLDEIAGFRRGSFPQPYGLPKWYDPENGFPFVQVYDVDDNMLLKPSTKVKISKLAAEQSVFVKKGSLVITIQGSIGRIAKTQYDAYVDRTLLIFQSFNRPIDIDYFKYVVYLLFEIEKTKAPGGTIKTITKEALSSFKIMLPSIEEQQKIASFLTALDAKIETVNQQIAQTQTFKKGLLQQMFV
jgi:type I restriction enzyme S subunit